MPWDILNESLIYQELVEQGLEKGRIQEQREMLIRLVQMRFPELLPLAKQQADGITNPEVLPPVNFKLIEIQTIEEARQLLLNINKGDTKH